MSDRCSSLGSGEVMGVKALRDTLCAQQELLQQLYAELDVERDAASTATNEALSMILRLQGEKAAVEMEASQYKRIAEEKMVHAEETLSIFKDLIYQKEMQIASLEFQVQAYRFKLQSLGCTDLSGIGLHDSSPHYPENMLTRRRSGGIPAPPSDLQIRVKRGFSLPPTFLKDAANGAGDAAASPYWDNRSTHSSPKMSPDYRGLVEGVAGGGGGGGGGDFTSYWEQIKRLEDRVKGLSFFKNSSVDDNSPEADENGFQKSFSFQSQASSNSFYDALRGEFTPRVVDGIENRPDPLEVAERPAAESKFQDVFEVPRPADQISTVSGGSGISGGSGKERKLFNLESENKPGRPDHIKPMIPEILDHVKGLEKKNFNLEGENKPDHIRTIIPELLDQKGNWDKTSSSFSADTDSKSSRRRDSFSAEHHMCFKRPDVTDFELQQMNRRLKRLEDDRLTPRHELVSGRAVATQEEITAEKGEGLALLRAIKEQLDIIQDEIENLRTKDATSRKEPPVYCLKEAMLHFWS